MVGVASALGFLTTDSLALAQMQAATTPDNAAATAQLNSPALALTFGPLHLHPRLTAGVTADDNLLFTSANQKSDIYWSVQPGFQAVIGDDDALVAMRDQHGDPLNLSPGSLIVQPSEAWLGKIVMLDYAPRFKFYDQYPTYNAIDEFATLNLLWPMNKLILGFRQDYQLQEQTIVEANRLAISENINSTLSAAYQFGDKTSLESNFRRASVSYDAKGLIGYTEYNTEDWFNYAVTPSLPVSLGVLAGYDEVAVTGQNQTYEQLRARVRYLFTQKLTFDVSAGGELRQYENGRADTLTPVFSLSASYQPATRTTLSLTGYRQQSASIFNGYNYTSTGATLALSQGITDRFTAGVSVGYYTLDYQAAALAVASYSDEYYTARFSLDAKLLRHLVGQIYYNLVSIQSSVSADRSDNQIGMNLTWSY